MRNVAAAGIIGLGVALASAPQAVAQDPVAGTDLVIELGAAARVAPSYPGADSYLFFPAPIVKLRFLVLPVFGAVADSRNQGLGFYPAFNFVGERDAADHAELTGLNTVDWSVELGGGIRYTSDWFEAYAELRHGFNGHDGLVGEIGIDAVARPTPALTLKAGPRLSFANGEYMETYFGVTAAEAAASAGRFTAFRAGGGIRDVGIQIGAAYALTEATTLYADAGYRRLVGDAAKSPIVKRTGSADQFTAGLGLTYRFSFDFDGR